MKVALSSGEVVKVWFEHQAFEPLHVEVINGKERLVSHRTICFIESVGPHSDTVHGRDLNRRGASDVFSGLAFTSHLDVFSKAKGRRVALTRALHCHFSRADRSLIWRAYLSQSKLPRKSS
jgi:hypothetical protein